jgi:CheY-like chemotaxis protein
MVPMRDDEQQPAQRPNILLVDDEPANLLALRAILEDLGTPVDQVLPLSVIGPALVELLAAG